MTAVLSVLCDPQAMEKPPQIPRERHNVDRQALGRRLAYIRGKLGMNGPEFADTIGLTKSNLSQVEKGNRLLTVDQIYRCFIVHGVPMEYLLVGQEARLPDHLKR